jgi:hypothetical protein
VVEGFSCSAHTRLMKGGARGAAANQQRPVEMTFAA